MHPFCVMLVSLTFQSALLEEKVHKEEKNKKEEADRQAEIKRQEQLAAQAAAEAKAAEEARWVDNFFLVVFKNFVDIFSFK